MTGRELKFDYVCKCDECGRIVHDYCTLGQIEERIDADFMNYWPCGHCADGRMVLLDRRQFTGLHDKNGKSGFENDMVKDTDGNLYLIEASVINSGWWLCLIGGTLFRKITNLYDWEIIGNRFENPELLQDVE